MAHHEERPNVVLISVIAGLVGAGIALLLAPRSGRETRQKLRSAAGGLKHQAKENYEDLRNQAQSTMQSANEMKHKITSAIKTRKDQGQQSMDEASDNTSTRRQSSGLTNWDEEI